MPGFGLSPDRMKEHQLWNALESRLIYLEPGSRKGHTFAEQRRIWMEARSLATELKRRGRQLRVVELDDE
jgi:hypothetical protein